MATPALSIANYFVERGLDEARPVSPMKLQKLVFFAHGWYLAVADQGLLDEKVEAWDYGPVVPSIYHTFKAYGRNPIDKPGKLYKFPDDLESFEFREVIPRVDPHNEEVLELLGTIWELYSGFSAVQLSNMTHQPGSPWARVKDEAGDRLDKGTDIPERYISEYFKAQLNRAEASGNSAA